MDIKSNKEDYKKALKKAHEEYPLMKGKYRNKPDECIHNYSFCVFCDGGDWDIMRCPKCGSERVMRCTFDDDFDQNLVEVEEMGELIKKIRNEAIINYSVAVLAEVAKRAKQEDAPIYEGDKEVDQWVRLSDVEEAINKYLN